MRFCSGVHASEMRGMFLRVSGGVSINHLSNSFTPCKLFLFRKLVYGFRTTGKTAKDIPKTNGIDCFFDLRFGRKGPKASYIGHEGFRGLRRQVISKIHGLPLQLEILAYRMASA